MRGRRNALWALGLAGAAYAWRNRDKLRSQLNNWRQQNQPAPRLQLPDSRRTIETNQSNTWDRTGQTKFGNNEL